MFTLTTPEEHILLAVAAGGPAAKVACALSYEDRLFEGLVRGGNVHVEIGSTKAEIILPGPERRGTLRRVTDAVIHNLSRNLVEIELYLQNGNSTPLRLLRHRLPPDLALTYGPGGWQAPPELAARG